MVAAFVATMPRSACEEAEHASSVKSTATSRDTQADNVRVSKTSSKAATYEINDCVLLKHESFTFALADGRLMISFATSPRAAATVAMPCDTTEATKGIAQNTHR